MSWQESVDNTIMFNYSWMLIYYFPKRFNIKTHIVKWIGINGIDNYQNNENESICFFFKLVIFNLSSQDDINKVTNTAVKFKLALTMKQL